MQQQSVQYGGIHVEHSLYPFIKRVADGVAALLMLILFSPLMLTVAVLIKAADGEEILFRQPRPGRYEIIFTLYKFKTMIRQTHAADGRPLSDMERITPLGKWLRRTSLDELPQLLNILKGEMSFIGPRPLLVRYLGHYTPAQARRHEVTPGLSGWAQVHGRNGVTWSERLAMDVWYVDHRCLWLDIRILCKTVISVLTGKGINRNAKATMPFFDEEPHEDRP